MGKTFLVTGGCGFIGSHTVRRLLEHDHEVLVVDDLSRPGSSQTRDELVSMGVDVHVLDIASRDMVRRYFDEKRAVKIDVVIHLAGQVAVTTSVKDPIRDMYVNVNGTVYLLENLRAWGRKPLVIFASTNKVYGHLNDTPLYENKTRYDSETVAGVRCTAPLDLYSPYGCSKGAADQYVRDWNRIYGIPTVVLRQSCIYGTEQYGIEDQGWVSWLTIAAMIRKRVNVYGDGKQVRDILYIDDLIDLYLMCVDKQDEVAGQVYNVGGGPNNTLSILELLHILRNEINNEFEVEFCDWRPGDQKWYVSSIKELQKLGWTPGVDPETGVHRLVDWVSANIPKIQQVLPEDVLK